MSAPTITALKRWSCVDRMLPTANKVEMIHIYDFDNTLFRTPLPNRQLWSGPSLGVLNSRDRIANGGWWHSIGFLENLGEGAEKEEARAWEGCWNEDVVDLVKLSMQQKDAVCILLTGRATSIFAGLIRRILKSKGLEFDLVVLKPGVGPSGESFSTTQNFKQAFIRAVVNTYYKANTLQIYEDRAHHVSMFKTFFTEMNREMLMAYEKAGPNSDLRSGVLATVTQVPPLSKTLNPVVEIAQVQKIINLHNTSVINGQAPPKSIPWKLTRSVLHTGYLLPPKVSLDLQSIVKVPNFVPRQEMNMISTAVLVRPSAELTELIQTGGTRIRQRWRVTHTCTLDNRLWAIQVTPVPADSQLERLMAWPPCIVLATRKGTSEDEVKNIKKWYPPPPGHRNFEFDTYLGEKSIIAIEEERSKPSVGNSLPTGPLQERIGQYQNHDQAPSKGGIDRKRDRNQDDNSDSDLGANRSGFRENESQSGGGGGHGYHQKRPHHEYHDRGGVEQRDGQDWYPRDRYAPKSGYDTNDGDNHNRNTYNSNDNNNHNSRDTYNGRGWDDDWEDNHTNDYPHHAGRSSSHYQHSAKRGMSRGGGGDDGSGPDSGGRGGPSYRGNNYRGGGRGDRGGRGNYRGSGRGGSSYGSSRGGGGGYHTYTDYDKPEPSGDGGADIYSY